MTTPSATGTSKHATSSLTRPSPGIRPMGLPEGSHIEADDRDRVAQTPRGFPTNPFATRWTRPGAIEFHFDGPSSIDELVEQLRANQWQGAIVGPHGSGKSTLLASLVSALRSAGRNVIWVALHDGQRTLPLARCEINRPSHSSVLVIDGFEQLGRLRRWRLASHCRRRGCGLVVTSHRCCGMPVVFRTEPRIGTIERLIEHSLPPHGGRIGRGDIEEAWRRHAGNIREVLFELYDLFEARRRL